MRRKQEFRKKLIGRLGMAVLGVVSLFAVSLQTNATAAPKYDYVVTEAEPSVNPTDALADTEGIQKVLNKAIGATEIVTIYFPAGKYCVDKSLKVYSNTHIVLDAGATMYRMDAGVDDMIIHNVDQNGFMDKVGGYEMSKNITIEGGVWDGGNTKLATEGTNIIRFDHAENITVKNATVKNTYDCHIIEFVGVKNGLIDNCTFTGFRYKKGKTTDYTYAREAVQLESAWTSNEKDLTDVNSAWAKGSVIDGSSCKQVMVSNCTFIDMPCGVGQHRYTDSGKYRNEDITITKNTFTCSNSMKYCKIAVTASGTNRLTVTDNTIKGPYRFAVHVLVADDVTIENNVIENIKMNGLMIDEGSVLSIKNNTIKNAKKHGISVGGGTVTEISGNTISKAKHNGISVDDGKVTTITQNTITNATKHGISIAGKTKKAKGATVTDVTANTITKPKQNGITVDAGKITNINDNKISSPGKHGISIAGAETKKKGGTIKNINNNTISKAKHNGICVDKGKVTLISGNTIKNSGKHGMSIVGGKVGTGKSNGILSNTITTCKQNGITVSGSGKVTSIAKNKITSAKRIGISMSGGAKVNYVTKNTCKKCGKTGIYCGGSSKPKMSGNK